MKASASTYALVSDMMVRLLRLLVLPGVGQAPRSMVLSSASASSSSSSAEGCEPLSPSPGPSSKGCSAASFPLEAGMLPGHVPRALMSSFLSPFPRSAAVPLVPGLPPPLIMDRSSSTRSELRVEISPFSKHVLVAALDGCLGVLTNLEHDPLTPVGGAPDAAFVLESLSSCLS